MSVGAGARVRGVGVGAWRAGRGARMVQGVGCVRGVRCARMGAARGLDNGGHDMAHSTDIVGHTYDAGSYCTRCVVHTLVARGELSPAAYDMPADEALRQGAEGAGIDWADERTFDSGEWPKVVFRGMLEDDEQCRGCGEELSDASSLDYGSPAGWPGS